MDLKLKKQIIKKGGKILNFVFFFSEILEFFSKRS
jgi:hypothetical protein